MTTFACALIVLRQTPQDFPDSVFKIPKYPGAERVPRSSQRLTIDPPIGWAQTFQSMSKGWGRMYKTKDEPPKVKAFLLKEGQKFGKWVPHKTGNSPTSFTLEFRFKNGDSLLCRGDSTGKGQGTRFELYYCLKER